MSCYLVETAINPWRLIDDYQQTEIGHHQAGAAASFVGTMRDSNENVEVTSMMLEHYPAMTERYLHKLGQEAFAQWPALQHCLIVHRVGKILPGEAIVVIACWSAHRRAALDACDWLIEQLKHQAPFWKKEQRPDGDVWVESNTDGHGPKTGK